MMFRLIFLALAIAVLLGGAVTADDATPPLDRQVREAFQRGDFVRTIELSRRYLESNPKDCSVWYTLAAALAQSDQHDEAADALLASVKAGFRDFDLMRGDPDLMSIRSHPVYEAILEAAKRVEADRPNLARESLKAWKADVGGPDYREEFDERRRLIYLTALDRRSHEAMRMMLDPQVEYLIERFFVAPPRDEVLVIVPDPTDARSLFERENIGGTYEHRRRRLVARDIGSTLRHEIVHVLHYGHMERLRQPHALWVQEGLAALFEDYEWTDDGDIRFLPNDRHNVMRNRVRSNRVMAWEALFALPADRFMARSGALYPQARSIFEFLADRGHLEAWYDAYVRRFDADGTGVQAFEEVFGIAVADIEAEWRRWVQERPAVTQIINPGDPSLGIETAPNVSNDGVLVTRLLHRPPGMSGLRVGDVIVEVSGRPTPTIDDLRREISRRQVGDRVTVRIRRGERYTTVPVVLQGFLMN